MFSLLLYPCYLVPASFKKIVFVLHCIDLEYNLQIGCSQKYDLIVLETIGELFKMSLFQLKKNLPLDIK